jgi:hypothetical protein
MTEMFLVCMSSRVRKERAAAPAEPRRVSLRQRGIALDARHAAGIKEELPGGQVGEQVCVAGDVKVLLHGCVLRACFHRVRGRRANSQSSVAFRTSIAFV